MHDCAGVDSLEVAAINVGTVHCLNGLHCFFPSGISDVCSNTGTLQEKTEKTSNMFASHVQSKNNTTDFSNTVYTLTFVGLNFHGFHRS